MSDIFDGNGHIIVGLDPATIPERQRSAYIALSAAQVECNKAESEQAAADKRVIEAMAARDRALAALPKSDFLTEWRNSR